MVLVIDIIMEQGIINVIKTRNKKLRCRRDKGPSIKDVGTKSREI